MTQYKEIADMVWLNFVEVTQEIFNKICLFIYYHIQILSRSLMPLERMMRGREKAKAPPAAKMLDANRQVNFTAFRIFRFHYLIYIWDSRLMNALLSNYK